MKTQYDIDMSPLTNRIYVGRTVPEALHWHGDDKRDVTEKAIHVVAEHVLREFSGYMILTAVDSETGDDVYYEIEVKKILRKYRPQMNKTE